MTKQQIIEKYGIEEYNRRLAYNRKVRNESYNNDPEYNAKYKEINKKNQYKLYHKNGARQYYMRKFFKLRYVRDGELEKIENYELALKDNFKGWDIHHRLEMSLENENIRSKDDLIRLNMYYDRPYFELIFLKKEDHHRLHGLINV